LVRDYAWLEEHLGELVPVEIVVNVKDSTGLTILEQMKVVEKLQQRIDQNPDIGSSLSAVTFAPELQSPAGRRNPLLSTINRAAERVRNERITEHIQDFLAGDYLRRGVDEYMWRISARVGALKNVDYAKFIHNLKSEVAPVLEAQRERIAHEQRKPVEDVDGIDVIYTGLVPIVYKAQTSLLDGLTVGFISDLVLIIIVMIVAVRSLAAGLLLTITSVFPAAVVFGLMGWSGIIVDVGTVMTPAVALGVTVDDVVHYLLWYRRGISDGLSRNDSVMLAYKGCARAMYQSWGVIGIGLSVFALSPFNPTQRFGFMMLTLLTAALPGNLLLMPALLAGPLGRLFAWRVKPAPPQNTAVPAPHAARDGARPRPHDRARVL
jgi:predicted RND superfamily exporter protein